MYSRLKNKFNHLTSWAPSTQTQKEKSRVKHFIPYVERLVAEGAAGAVKGTVSAILIFSGASLPVVGLISIGLLPNNTVLKLGKIILGRHFTSLIDLQQISVKAQIWLMLKII